MVSWLSTFNMVIICIYIFFICLYVCIMYIWRWLRQFCTGNIIIPQLSDSVIVLKKFVMICVAVLCCHCVNASIFKLLNVSVGEYTIKIALTRIVKLGWASEANESASTFVSNSRFYTKHNYILNIIATYHIYVFICMYLYTYMYAPSTHSGIIW